MKPAQPRSSRRQEPPSFSPPAWLEQEQGRRRESKAACDAVAFRAQVAQWAARLRVKPRQVRIQPMRRKWASCSTRGTVSFNADLLEQSEGVREYVIVHELLHLKVPNHGKLFQTLFRAYLPNHDSIRPQPPPLEGIPTGSLP